jgi:hypothetical protein
MTPEHFDDAVKVIQLYDETIRRNRTPGWDTLANVVEFTHDAFDCGSFGEVLEAAVEFGWRQFEPDGSYISEGRQAEYDEFVDVLSAVFEGWIIGLRGQVAAEAAQRAWREQT